MASDNPKKRPKRSEEFDKFEALTKRLLDVPKPEIDKAVERERKARQKRTAP